VAEQLAAAAEPDARSGDPAAAAAVVRLGPVAAALASLFAAQAAAAAERPGPALPGEFAARARPTASEKLPRVWAAVVAAGSQPASALIPERAALSQRPSHLLLVAWETPQCPTFSDRPRPPERWALMRLETSIPAQVFHWGSALRAPVRPRPKAREGHPLCPALAAYWPSAMLAGMRLQAAACSVPRSARLAYREYPVLQRD
jgi:hypothetical protein